MFWSEENCKKNAGKKIKVFTEISQHSECKELRSDDLFQFAVKIFDQVVEVSQPEEILLRLVFVDVIVGLKRKTYAQL